jgi:hypothetical protein
MTNPTTSGMLVWWTIIRAIERLQAKTRAADEGVH